MHATKSARIAGAAYQFPGQPHELVTDAAIPNSPLGTMEQCKSRLGDSGTEYCEDLFLALGDLDTFWKDEFLKIAGKNQKYSPPKRFTYYKPEGRTRSAATRRHRASTARPRPTCTPARSRLTSPSCARFTAREISVP